MKLIRNEAYTRKERKFLKKHPDLLKKYGEVLTQLTHDPFNPILKTHKLKGELSDFYSCRLTYEYRIICLFVTHKDVIVLVDIGTHDEVY